MILNFNDKALEQENLAIDDGDGSEHRVRRGGRRGRSDVVEFNKGKGFFFRGKSMNGRCLCNHLMQPCINCGNLFFLLSLHQLPLLFFSFSVKDKLIFCFFLCSNLLIISFLSPRYKEENCLRSKCQLRNEYYRNLQLDTYPDQGPL